MHMKLQHMIFRPQDVICMARLVVVLQVASFEHQILLSSALLIFFFLVFDLQGKKYSERVMLIYDGLHYDALAV